MLKKDTRITWRVISSKKVGTRLMSNRLVYHLTLKALTPSVLLQHPPMKVLIASIFIGIRSLKRKIRLHKFPDV